MNRKQWWSIFWLGLMVGFAILGLCSCSKKEDPKPKTSLEITYEFYSDQYPYCIRIWDITNLNDFTDSCFTTNYTKTITYDYNETFRSRIEANSKGLKTIKITSNSAQVICSDSLYSNLDCFIHL